MGRMMTVRELRVRYELTSAMGQPVIHAVVCRFPMLAAYVRDIKEAGYKLIGIDERYRDENKRMYLDEGWSEVKSKTTQDD